MKHPILQFFLLTVIASGSAFPAEQTWVGEISTEMCKGTKGADAHDCILMCAKSGNKFVFFGSRGFVRQISNQDFGALAKHAGHVVKITGTLSLSGDALTVVKIDMASSWSRFRSQ